MKSIEEIKRELKEKLPSGIDLIIPLIKNYVVHSSSKYDDIILLESRYHGISRKVSLDLIDDRSSQIEFNNLQQAILNFINDLNLEDIVKEEVEIIIEQGKEKKKNYEQLEYGIFQHEDGRTEIKVKNYDFFGSRLSKAFPGVRGLKWFGDPEDIVKRIEILLKEPLIFDIHPGKGTGQCTPIWWFRGESSMFIDSFKALNKTKFILNQREFDIEKIAVYKDYANDDRSFIYLKTKSELGINFGENLDEKIKRQLSYNTYSSQEYALYRGISISREEYDDGAATINGEIVELNGEAELRIKYLTPYNFIICAVSAVYNSGEGDRFFGQYLDGILLGGDDSNTLENFIKYFLTIPINQRYAADFL